MKVRTVSQQPFEPRRRNLKTIRKKRQRRFIVKLRAILIKLTIVPTRNKLAYLIEIGGIPAYCSLEFTTVPTSPAIIEYLIFKHNIKLIEQEREIETITLSDTETVYLSDDDDDDFRGNPEYMNISSDEPDDDSINLIRQPENPGYLDFHMSALYGLPDNTYCPEILQYINPDFDPYLLPQDSDIIVRLEIDEEQAREGELPPSNYYLEE